MSSSRPNVAFDPLDPTVPLETVEEWIEAPPQPTQQVAYAGSVDYPEPAVAAEPVTEYVEVPETVSVPTTQVAVAPDYVHALGDTEVLQPVAAPDYVHALGDANVQETIVQQPVYEEQIVEQPVYTEQVDSIYAPGAIEPVRSPGIVLPAPPEKEPVKETVAEEIEEESTPWSKHLLPWLFLILAVLVCLFALAQLVPGWWSRFIAGLVDGYSGRGAAWGAGIGFLFTYLATMMIGHAVHKWASWKAPLALVIGGLIVAAPNLFTLWINHGPTTAARTANALLDRTAPLFRGASLAGAAGGLVLGILTTILYRNWRKRTRRIKAMESLVDDYA